VGLIIDEPTFLLNVFHNLRLHGSFLSSESILASGFSSLNAGRKAPQRNRLKPSKKFPHSFNYRKLNFCLQKQTESTAETCLS
jgi:hypothetical protein